MLARMRPETPATDSSSPAPIQLAIADQTFVAVDRTVLAELVADPVGPGQWWPDLQLQLTRDRGLKGRQWVITGSSTGSITGTAEIYLEPWQDGTVIHLFLRLTLPARAARRPERVVRARTLAWKRTVTSIKDEFEADRRPGTAARSSL